MLVFAWYLIKVMLCSGILFGYYWIVLRNKRFHLYNRFYLLATVILSWLIPLLKISLWEETPQKPQIINLLTVVANGDRYLQQANQFKWDWSLAATLIAALISLVFLTQLIVAVVKIKRLITNNPTQKWKDIHFVFTNAEGTPFSFFTYIFWNDQTDLNSPVGQQILKHELSHVQEKHSLDKIFISLVLIAGWYNPFTWLIRKELNMIHEFIADQTAVRDGDAHSFAAMILKTAFPAQSHMLTNSFFHSPIKRRLIMLTSSKKTSFSYLRRVAVLPLLMLISALFAFSIKKEKAPLDTSKPAGSNAIQQLVDQDILNEQQLIAAFGDLRQDTTRKKKGNTISEETSDKTRRTFSDSSSREVNVNIDASQKNSNENLNKALVIVDGKEMKLEQFEKTTRPEQIQRIDVLKGATAIEKYGDKGKNGVMEIITKPASAIQNIKEEYPRVFTVVENPPYYANGMAAFAKYINSNIQYPSEAVQAKIEGAVLIQFIVNEEGKLTDFKKLSSKGHGLEEEAVRLLKNSGDWKPGLQNGRKVPVQIQQQVIFELPGKS